MRRAACILLIPLAVARHGIHLEPDALTVLYLSPYEG